MAATGAPQVLAPLAGGPADQMAAAKERGTKAFRKKDFAGAVKAYTEALAIAPDDHGLFSNRSAAYGALEQYKESWLDAKECVRLRPDWPKGYARLGFSLSHLFRLEEAKKAYETGLTLDPDKDVAKTLNSGLEDVATKLEKEAIAEAEAEKKERSAKGANRRQGLNHKPAWQSRGLGVNKELFGEVTGDLMKPGLTKADLERIENSLPEGPDPFGDVFREGGSDGKVGKGRNGRKGGNVATVVGSTDDGVAAAKMMDSLSKVDFGGKGRVVPIPAHMSPASSKAGGVRTYQAISAAPWRRMRDSAKLGASTKAKAAPPPQAKVSGG